MMRSPTTQRRLALLAAALVAVIAAVHFQQYVDFMSQVPTVGVLFLLNAAAGAGIAAALLSHDIRLRWVAATAAVGLALGSLASIMIALQSSFFGYAEPTLRFPIVLAIIAEVAVLPVLGLLLLRRSPAAIASATS
jgi:hypothetical protein